ncbi:MAG: TetR/AcrR family transcriptional regulator [Acidimicrobiales bacterium]
MADNVDARERILTAAEPLVLSQGFAATTVDAVLARAGASKGAFFHHFPSKVALGRALVERYAQRDAELLESTMAAVESVTDDPAEQLVRFFERFEEAADRMRSEQPGCLFVSFIYESGIADDATNQIVTTSILHWRARLLDKLQQAATDRPHLDQVDLPSLADQAFTTFEGAFLLARALDDPTCVRSQIAHLRHYFELLLEVA